LATHTGPHIHIAVCILPALEKEAHSKRWRRSADPVIDKEPCSSQSHAQVFFGFTCFCIGMRGSCQSAQDG
jgi:hypothetical protein